MLNSDSSIEGVIIISSDKVSPEDLLKNLPNTEKLLNSTSTKNIHQFKWYVDTKYYTSEVHLYSVQEKVELDSTFCSTIRATIFYFDGHEPSDFENILGWMPFLKNINSEIQLLVCDSCSETESHKKNVLNWCVENEFELIELNENEESDEEEEKFLNSRGYSRVIEALQSYTWSNLIVKNTTHTDTSQSHADLCKKDETVTSNDSKSMTLRDKDENSKRMKVRDEEVLLEEQWLQNVLDQDDPDGESFEALFSKFASMKEKAAGLTGEARKKYAEEVAIAFWKAMGGAEDEIEGLDDE